MAQLVARLVRNEKVRGSIPLRSTKAQGPVNRGLALLWLLWGFERVRSWAPANARRRKACLCARGQ